MGFHAKGMPTWEKQLSAKQISDVANYVKSLHGTNPANAKEPQGNKETDQTAEQPQKRSGSGNIKETNKMEDIVAGKEAGKRAWLYPLIREGPLI